MPKADPDARPVKPSATPSVRPSSKIQHEEQAGQIDFSPRQATALSIWVEDPDKIVAGGYTRQGAVSTALDVWNKALGYEALQFAETPESADIRVRGGKRIGFILTREARSASFEGERGKDNTLIGRSTPGEPEIRLGTEPQKEWAWKPDTIEHEIGHALGLYHFMNPKNPEKISLDPSQVMSYAKKKLGVHPQEALQTWTNIANDVYGIPISLEAMQQILASTGSQTEDDPGAEKVIEATGDWRGENRNLGVESTLRQWAANIYPQFASQINAGVPPRALLDPYLQAASGILGYNVRLSDPVMMNGLMQGSDQKFNMVSMADFLGRIRQTETWDDSPEAERVVNEFIGALGRGPNQI